MNQDHYHGSRPGEHDHQHPDFHFRGREWSEEQTLHVVTPYSNPCRWDRRRELLNNFRRHMAASANVVLHVGELAYGDRPFEVTDITHPLDVQFRSRQELWHKENIANLVVQRFPADWKYGAIIDGDFHFTRHDWALEAVQLLQHYDFVQLYSTYSDLSPDHRPLRLLPSFADRWIRGELSSTNLGKVRRRGGSAGPGKGVGTTGGAWAFRRSAFEAVGGFLDTCILGSADWHMAFGLIGEPDTHPSTAELTRCGARYAESIKIWQTRAAAAIRKNIGRVECHALHYFHGSKYLRGYENRWKILRDLDFDPRADLFRDAQGIYQLAPHRVALRDAIRGYFRSRNEDSTSLLGRDAPLA